MTDYQTTSDRPSSPALNLPRRPGLWRVISLLAVVAALVVSTLTVLQARDASDVVIPDRAPLEVEETTVIITDLPIPASAEIAVLGLPDSESRRTVDVEGTKIDLPKGMAAVIALTNANRALVGLAVVPEGEDRDQVLVSANSTAQALLILSPGILRPNLAETFANIGVVESDSAYERLVEAIRANPNLSENNDAVEQAYAEIADRLPIQRPASDQGCDSVIARNAYASSGACVQPESTGLVITNEQDRWALIYSGVSDYRELCATVSPTDIAGDEVLIPTEQCVGASLIVAPGPTSNEGSEDQDIVDQRVRAAAAVNTLYDFAGPFADLAGGSAGFSEDSVTHIRRNSADVVGSLALLAETNGEFSAAMDVSRIASTALDRHIAAVSATRIIIQAADTTTLIPQRSAGDTGHEAILDFFGRAGERMISDRTDWRWEADAVGRVDFGGGA